MGGEFRIKELDWLVVCDRDADPPPIYGSCLTAVITREVGDTDDHIDGDPRLRHSGFVSVFRHLVHRSPSLMNAVRPFSSLHMTHRFLLGVTGGLAIWIHSTT